MTDKLSDRVMALEGPDREMGEKWVDIPGYEGIYRISDHGRVARVAWRNSKGGILRAQKCGGYLRIKLAGKDHVRRAFYVHRLVLHSFIGPCPEGKESRHLNGVSTDNRLANLQWGTRAENINDRTLHGRNLEDARRRMVLNEDQIRFVMENRRKITIKKLASMMGVSPAIIGEVHVGRYAPRARGL